MLNYRMQGKNLKAKHPVHFIHQKLFVSYVNANSKAITSVRHLDLVLLLKRLQCGMRQTYDLSLNPFSHLLAVTACKVC